MRAAKSEAAEAWAAEREFRDKLRRAVASIVVPANRFLSVGSLRNHLSKYYGGLIAWGATTADLQGAVAAITDNGALDSEGRFYGASLRAPGNKVVAAIRKDWDRKIPPPVKLLRRGTPKQYHGAGWQPGGTILKVDGIHRATQEPETAGAVEGGGDGHGGRAFRKRRFARYIAGLNEYLRRSVISPVDRMVLEHIAEGRTIRWVAKETGMSRSVIGRLVRRHQGMGGIASPGPGR